MFRDIVRMIAEMGGQVPERHGIGMGLDVEDHLRGKARIPVLVLLCIFARKIQHQGAHQGMEQCLGRFAPAGIFAGHEGD